jgi:hypothetical protein
VTLAPVENGDHRLADGAPFTGVDAATVGEAGHDRVELVERRGAFVAALACDDRESGRYVIKGVVQRFNRAAPAYYVKDTASKLIDSEACPATSDLDERTLMDLAKLAATSESGR